MTIDPTFAAGMRQQLIETAAGDSPLARRSRHLRLAVGVGTAAAAIALLTAGAVIAATLPGEHLVTFTGPTITQQYTGSATVDVSQNSAESNAVQVTITCTSAGAFEVAFTDGSGVQWECGDGAAITPIGRGVTTENVPLINGQIVFDVVTGASTTWTATLHYIHSETTDWGVNANGDTYGVPNENGVPTLHAVLASNCELGYVYWDDFMSATDGDAIPVYESDGETVVGEFWFGNAIPVTESDGETVIGIGNDVPICEK